MTVSIATDTWKRKSSGLWSVAGNWSGGVPRKGVNVVIAPVAAETVTFNISGLAIGALTLQGATLNLTGGALTASAGATLKTATLTGSHALNINGASSVTGLTVAGTASLSNQGVVTQSGGQVAIGDGAASKAQIVNLAGATWIDADNSAISATGGLGFLNNGVFKASAATGATAITANFVSTGTVTVAVGGAMVFSPVGAQTDLSGAFDGGGAIEYGPSDIATLGALTVTATNQINQGTVNQVGALTLLGAQTIQNLGHWNLDGDVSMLAGAGANPANEFISTGVFAKTAGTGVSVVAASVDIVGGLNVATGTLDFTAALNGFAGAISGAGTFEIASGTAQFQPGVSNTEAISVAHFLLAGGTADIIGAVTDSGAFQSNAGATLALTGGYLNLTGATSFAGLNVSGSGELIVASAATVSGMTIAGATEVFATGAVTQSGGNVSLAETVLMSGSNLTLAQGGVWNIADASGIGLATASGGSIAIGYGGTNALFEKSGAGVSTIAPFVLNNSSNVATSSGVAYEGIEAAAGTLDLQNGVAGTGADNIVGAATLQFDNAVAAGQTVSFFGAGGALVINDIKDFKATIAGFDTVGSADALLIGGQWLNPVVTDTATATSATLTIASGGATYTLTLAGDYQGGAFSAQSLANGNLKITY